MSISRESSHREEENFATIGEAIEVLKQRLPPKIVAEYFENIRGDYEDINLSWDYDFDANVLIAPQAGLSDRVECVSGKEMLALYLRNIILRLIQSMFGADADMELIKSAVATIRNFIKDELEIDVILGS